jgi:hypothetical protein
VADLVDVLAKVVVGSMVVPSVGTIIDSAREAEVITRILNIPARTFNQTASISRISNVTVVVRRDI